MIQKLNICVCHEEYFEEVYVSRPEIVKSFTIAKDSGHINGILEIDTSIFNDKEDWVVIRSKYRSQYRAVLKTVLGNYTPFPVAWQKWVEMTMYKAEEFATIFNFKDKKLKKLVSHYLRKTAKGKIISSAEVLQNYLQVNKEFRRNWTQIYYQKIYLLREVARTCGQLKEYDNYVGWHSRPVYTDYKKNPVKPQLKA